MGCAMSRCIRITGDSSESYQSEKHKRTNSGISNGIQSSENDPKIDTKQSASTSKATSSPRLSSNWFKKSIIRKRSPKRSSDKSDNNDADISERFRGCTITDESLPEEYQLFSRNTDHDIDSDDHNQRHRIRIEQGTKKERWMKFLPFKNRLFGHDRNAITFDQHFGNSLRNKDKQHKRGGSNITENQALCLAYQAGSSIDHANDVESTIPYGQQNFEMHTDRLFRNFQGRLASTHDPSTKTNLKLTQSQIEFFRMLDEKIAQGASFDRDSYS